MNRILVTGAGGIGGVNFVRALRATKENFHIVGMDFNPYYLQFGDLDSRIQSLKHSDPEFIKLIIKILKENKIDFLHPQPSSETLVIAQNKKEIPVPVLLPEQEILQLDKLKTQKLLLKKEIPVASTKIVKSSEEIEDAFKSMTKNKPLWIRAKKGAGGNLSLLCQKYDEAYHWIKLWVLRGKASYDDFMIQEYLPGKNIAWDSFWYEGKFIASFTRERIEYPFKHISPSGITGTPTVSKIIKDSTINEIGKKAIKAIDPYPHGNYAVDLKGDSDGKYLITEIDSGKFHTTTPLWGYISTRILKQDLMKNLPYLYVKLGTGVISEPEILGFDIYPEELYLLRHMDCGVWLWREDGYKEKVL